MEITVAMLTIIACMLIPHKVITAMMKQKSCSISTTQSIQSFGRSYLKISIFGTCIKYDPTVNGSQRGTHTFRMAITTD